MKRSGCGRLLHGPRGLRSNGPMRERQAALNARLLRLVESTRDLPRSILLAL